MMRTRVASSYPYYWPGWTMLLLLVVLVLLQDGPFPTACGSSTTEVVMEHEEETVDLDDNDSSHNPPSSSSSSSSENFATNNNNNDDATTTSDTTTTTVSSTTVVQSGPLVDLFGPTLLSLEYTSPTTATLQENLTLDALRGKSVIGVYFSADWCGPCRQFTPELVQFYHKMNRRRRGRGKQDSNNKDFEIVWISRCRDVDSYGQYFTEMPWVALPPQEAMGRRGEFLSQLYGVKSIPTLVLLDDFGNVITKDGRNMIPKDKAGIGFPWRNPLSSLYVTVVPRSLRFLMKEQLKTITDVTIGRIKRMTMGLWQKNKR